jgi:tetratricopeptide (TPR) repeat protein
VHRALLLLLLPSAALLAAPSDTAAVLPFANTTSTTNVDWIGVSVAENLRDALSSRGLVTLGRDDIQEAYRRLHLRDYALLTEASALKVGETLDAEQMIYGTFEFHPSSTTGAGQPGASGGSLKISARIVDRRQMRQTPEFAETGALEDLATLEAHLAWRTLFVLAPKLAPEESDFRTLRAPIRLDAEENYIRGLMSRQPEQREKYFVQAARLDARFIHPCFQLGLIHYNRKEYRQAADWLQKATPSDVEYHEASFFLGLALFQAADYAGAQHAFQVVAAAVPLSEVYNNLAAAESRRNLPQAIDDFRKALDGDPNDPVYHFNLGYALFKKGDFAQAADRFRAVLDRNPDDQLATLLLGRCLKKQALRPGDSADARLQTLERLKTNYEERAYRQLKSVMNPGIDPIQP